MRTHFVARWLALRGGLHLLLATRREAQTVYYRIADRNAERLLSLLKRIYCR